MNISGLFNNFLRQLLGENSISTVNGLAGKGLTVSFWVPARSSSGGGDVTVYVFDINQPNLPTPVYSVIVSISVCMALSTVFHSFRKISRQLSAFSLRSSGLIFARLVLSTLYLFMKSFLQP